MSGLEITLMILGVILILLSFLLTDRAGSEKGSKEGEGAAAPVWSEKDEKLVRQRVESVLNGTADSLILDAEEQLNHLSNEKIMSLNEYSDQILDKINENHREVVFMYNMLNEKQDEIKAWVHDVDKKRAAWEDDASMEASQSDSSQAKLPPNVAKKQLPEPRVAAKTDGQVKKRAASQAAKMNVAMELGVVSANSGLNAAKRKKDVGEEAAPTLAKESTQTLNDTSIQGERESVVEMDDENRKRTILQLNKKGKSVREISKLLDMGQGEVKLVIDLFQG